MQDSRSFAQVVAEGASMKPAEVDVATTISGVRVGMNTTAETTVPTGAPTDSVPLGGAGPLPIVRLPGGESYADAVKSRSVKLNGVPVSAGKVLGYVESLTNSTLQEQESVLSSWADDDQCFFDSIRIAHEAAKKDGVEQPQQGRDIDQSTGSFRQRRGRRGWRFIGVSEGSRNSGRRRRGYNNNNNNN
ncbi:hypothetical protein TcYC6_0123020 [Trypanosoma cruzi]|nr:hypothetical protein TcYC6_0123020 [Trypanosoma cruzi]